MAGNRPDPQKNHFITRIYRIALACFPKGYRREYADELLYAVRMSVAEADAQGRVALIRLAFHELRDLPLAILRAQFQERGGSMNLQPGAHLPGGPLRIWQLGAVLLPFLLVILNPLQVWAYQNALTWLIPAFYLTIFGLLVVVWAAGLVGEFPIWTLPALGILLFFVGAFLHMIAQFVIYFAVRMPMALLALLSGKGLSMHVGRIWPDGLSLAGNIGFSLLLQLLYLIIVVLLAAGLLSILPHFRTRVRQEWTLLSFLLYGTAIFPLFIAGDEFHGVEWYQGGSILILVLGAGLYMIVRQRWQRVLALVFAAVLSPVLLSLGFYQLFPYQDWAVPGDFSFRMWEAIQPVLNLASLPVLLLLAWLAPRLPWRGIREPASPCEHRNTDPCKKNQRKSVFIRVLLIDPVLLVFS